MGCSRNTGVARSEEALRGVLASLPGEITELADLIEAAAGKAEKHLLLVLDQFEEFVILAKPEQREAFKALVVELQSRQVKGLSLLLVLRSDYQTFLEEIVLPPLRHGGNFFQVGRFTLSAGSDFMRHSQLDLQPDALDRLMTSAAELDETPGLIRPITLNVIGYVLASGREKAPSLDAGPLVRRYIEQTVNQPAIRGFAPPILEQLITEQGTKQPRSEQDLAKDTSLRPGEVRAVLTGLGAAALARPLDPAQGIWELSHDFVARAVARYLGRRRRDLLRRSAPYAAPALVAVMLVAGTGVFIWNRWRGDQLRLELADLGINVISTVVGQSAEVNQSRFKRANLAEACLLLARVKQVKALDLHGTEVHDLEPLKGLTALQTLVLANTQVRDLEPLKGLTALQTLDVSHTKVADLAPVQYVPNLEVAQLCSMPKKEMERFEDYREEHHLSNTPMDWDCLNRPEE
jgi:Leucine Rich repeats (2 copies)